MTEFWDMPRISREFGVAANTVQSTWRNETLNAVRAHLAAAGFGPEIVGVPLEMLTRSRWDHLRREYGLKPLKLPAKALPLPDYAMVRKPCWRPVTIAGWAGDTGRLDESGNFAAARAGRPRAS